MPRPMPGSITIAFDVKGSDHGPMEVVRGAAQLSLEAPHIHALLVGQRAAIDAALAGIRHKGERISVHPAPDFVGMGEKPEHALPDKPEASLAAAAPLVADGQAAAIVAPGNTEAPICASAPS